MELVLISLQAELLYPLTLSRPASMLRAGTLAIASKWERLSGIVPQYIVEERLRAKYTRNKTLIGPILLVNDRLVPEKNIAGKIMQLNANQGFRSGNEFIAACFNDEHELNDFLDDQAILSFQDIASEAQIIAHASDLFLHADEYIRQDFELLSKGKSSRVLSDDNRLIGPLDQLFIEEGAHIHCSMINTTAGPVYIGKGAEVMEGCMIRGPFSLGSGASLKMGSKIYGPSVIGPYSKVGGEYSNSVILGYTNKAHDGFLGNSVIGEWCNLGADTNTSNLKNNYGKVKIWSYKDSDYVDSGLTFCGLIMGDHSKCGINTMFNTGTTVGVCANIFGAGFPSKFIPSFTWGGQEQSSTYELDQAIITAKRVYARRGRELDKIDTDILTDIFHFAAKYRS